MSVVPQITHGLLACTLAISLSACDLSRYGRSSIDLDNVEGLPGFVMKDRLTAAVVRSSDPKDDGDMLMFVGLSTDTPVVRFMLRGTESPLLKAYEDEAIVTLILVASGSGSVDAFVIDKATGKFARAQASAVLGVSASASVGYCK